MKSKNEMVQNFLAEALVFDTEKYHYLLGIREIIFDIYPKAEERMMYGGIMFSTKSEDFCGLFVRKKHISLEFSNGTGMKDPNKLLEGTGKFRRHLKIKSDLDIKDKDVTNFIKQAVTLYK